MTDGDFGSTHLIRNIVMVDTHINVIRLQPRTPGPISQFQFSLVSVYCFAIKFFESPCNLPGPISIFLNIFSPITQ